MYGKLVIILLGHLLAYNGRSILYGHVYHAKPCLPDVMSSYWGKQHEGDTNMWSCILLYLSTF